MSVDPTGSAVSPAGRRGGPAVLRCTEHPGRPAHDRCPRCDRPRCDADAVRFGALGCGGCEREARPTRLPGRLELVVRAGLASLPAALIGGWIATQYVDDHIFSVLVPGLLGLGTSWAASAALPRRARGARLTALAVGALAAVLGTALGFRLVTGGRQSVLHPFSVVGAPYLCAVLGAVLWPILIGGGGSATAASPG